MLREIRPAIMMMVLFTLDRRPRLPARHDRARATAVSPSQSAGSLVTRDGQVVGSRLIGQNFTKPEYFHPRPSATGGTDPNDASKTIAGTLQSGGLQRLEPRPDLEGAARPRGHATRKPCTPTTPTEAASRPTS